MGTLKTAKVKQAQLNFYKQTTISSIPTFVLSKDRIEEGNDQWQIVLCLDESQVSLAN